MGLSPNGHATSLTYNHSAIVFDCNLNLCVCACAHSVTSILYLTPTGMLVTYMLSARHCVLARSGWLSSKTPKQVPTASP